MSRRYTSKRDLAEMFLRQEGKCCVQGCDVKLAKVNGKANYIIEHRQALKRGGTDTLDNKEVRCIPHADEKTFHPRSKATTLCGDIFEIAKTKRIVRKRDHLKPKKPIASRGFQKPPEGHKYTWPKRSMGRK